MNIIIYNINSFGGNYEYAKYLFEAYQENKGVQSAVLLMPNNAEYGKTGVSKLLLSDLISSKSKFIKRIYYLYRSILNPYKLFLYLRNQPPSVVIFNDFDQLTSWFWAPFFHSLKKKHIFSVILHDPDRNKFFPVKLLSRSSMSAITSFMDIAFYHGFLPNRPYYPDALIKVDIPHGIYSDTNIDKTFLDSIAEEVQGHKIVGILGNIRDEKNYKVVIDALSFMPGVQLLIAGKAANSGISTEAYKKYAAEKNVSHRIMWREDYLSQEAFNAAITICDIVLLYYKPTFTSQSGVLNTIAPFKKKLIISDAESSLKKSVMQYDLGHVVSHDKPELLANAVKELLSLSAESFSGNWNNYIKDSSWDKHVSIAVDAINKLR